MKKGPCKDCMNRTITCHVICQRYEEWKKENEKQKEWERKFKHESSDQVAKGERRKLINQARGFYKKRRRIGE